MLIFERSEPSHAGNVLLPPIAVLAFLDAPLLSWFSVAG
jgi:hypothetical protein